MLGASVEGLPGPLRGDFFEIEKHNFCKQDDDAGVEWAAYKENRVRRSVVVVYL